VSVGSRGFRRGEISSAAPGRAGIQEGMNPSNHDTTTWPDLAIGLYDKLTGRGAEITYEFQNLEVSVPSSASNSAQHATWRVNGTMKVRTRDDAASRA
jgi:hypothetical protein